MEVEYRLTFDLLAFEPAKWPQPTGITTAATAPVTDVFRPDTPEPNQ